jgi:glycosyltransferase involved in cell wall biosynthesis
MKHIVVIAGYASSLINFRGALLRELVIRGHKVTAAAPISKDVYLVRKQLADMGVSFKTFSLFRSGLNPLQDYHSYREIYLILKNSNPDIVLAYTAKPVIYSGIAIRHFFKINFYPLITGLGYGFIEHNSIKRKIIKYLMVKLYKKALKRASAILFQNSDDESLFSGLKIFQKKDSYNYIVNGSGIDLIKYPYSTLPSQPIFLMMARLLIDKGVREYVEAARIVRLSFPNAIFQLAGKLDPNPANISSTELQRWINSGHIQYLGYVKCTQSTLKLCRFYVLPSYREGVPRSVLEALATGRPVITTDVPGCRETVIHEKNGLLVPPRDSKALANAMIRLLEEKEEIIQKMAQESFLLAKHKYNVNKVNQNILDIMGL